MISPGCGHPVAPGARFCRMCGIAVGAAPVASRAACPSCDAGVAPGQRFCRACGAAIREGAVAVPVILDTDDIDTAVDAVPAPRGGGDVAATDHREAAPTPGARAPTPDAASSPPAPDGPVPAGTDVESPSPQRVCAVCGAPAEAGTDVCADCAAVDDTAAAPSIPTPSGVLSRWRAMKRTSSRSGARR